MIQERVGTVANPGEVGLLRIAKIWGILFLSLDQSQKINQ